MAPTKGQNKASPKVSKGASTGKPSKDRVSKSSSGSGSGPPSSSKNKGGKRPPPKEVKGQSRSAPENLKKKKQRQYTEKELNLPELNTITPVGVTKPRGKKKGKTYVDDQVFIIHRLSFGFFSVAVE